MICINIILLFDINCQQLWDIKNILKMLNFLYICLPCPTNMKPAPLFPSSNFQKNMSSRSSHCLITYSQRTNNNKNNLNNSKQTQIDSSTAPAKINLGLLWPRSRSHDIFFRTGRRNKQVEMAGGFLVDSSSLESSIADYWWRLITDWLGVYTINHHSLFTSRMTCTCWCLSYA